MKLRWLWLSLLLLCFAQNDLLAETTAISSSRANAVHINVPSLKSFGTGFFFDAEHVVTAFHVVGTVDVNGTKTPAEAEVTIGSDVAVILSTGETISAQVVAPKLQENTIKLIDPLPPAIHSAVVPILTDFAILKLKQKPKTPVIANPLFRGQSLPPVGSEIFFSGYPLGAPTMLTHKGIISGITADQAIICIEAPINKGNSGGALLDERGNVIGIITNREGGISKGLQEVAAYISETQKHGGVALMGVDPLAVIQELIKTIDMYISPGIGYARTIKHVVDFTDRNPDTLK
jgi:S1-C subfamily serine protease